MTIDDPRLQELLDKQEITEVLYRYCRGLDRMDRPLLETVFHPDSTHEHGEFVGRSVDFIGFALDLLSRHRCTTHDLGNILIELNGDTAYTEAYFYAYLRIPSASGQFEEDDELINHGRYIDRFERRNNRWAIAHRYGIWDWRRIQPCADKGFFSLPARCVSVRGVQDLSYQRAKSPDD